MSANKVASWKYIPRGVWALGFVSMFMDISSEMIHALFPIYLVAVLGASMVTVGFIEGIAEATALITKVFSGSGVHQSAAAGALLAAAASGAAPAKAARAAGMTRAMRRAIGSPGDWAQTWPAA